MGEEDKKDDQLPEEEAGAESLKETEDLISKANVAAARMEKANAEMAGLLQRQEKLRVESVLSGAADAGSQEKNKEQLEIESAKKFLDGTGFENMFEEQAK